MIGHRRACRGSDVVIGAAGLPDEPKGVGAVSQRQRAGKGLGMSPVPSYSGRSDSGQGAAS